MPNEKTAQIAIATALRIAKEEIDKTYGPEYAIKNPALVSNMAAIIARYLLGVLRAD